MKHFIFALLIVGIILLCIYGSDHTIPEYALGVFDVLFVGYIIYKK